MSRRRQLLVAVALGALLAGCEKELYRGLSQEDANAILVALLAQNVEGTKTTEDGGKTWMVGVQEGELGTAISVLRANNLPPKQYDTLGELFKKDGIVSTPAEEHIRFIYGISQELAATIAKIDGVLTARVHIVLPNNDPLASDAKPSSASVFVRYNAATNVDELVPAIKNLVSHSVEGLSYSQVTVTLVAGTVTMPPPREHPFAIILWVVIALLAAAVGFAALRFRSITEFSKKLLERMRQRKATTNA